FQVVEDNVLAFAGHADSCFRIIFKNFRIIFETKAQGAMPRAIPCGLVQDPCWNLLTSKIRQILT
ncbi:MAG: hypothetical protein IKL39_05930, partial [Mailhella sp.]|nr:hypothetical protein [Mailhella sp.]